MEKQLTKSEIEQTLKVARIIALNLTPEQFQSLADSLEYLAEEGFLEGAWAAAKLHREKGISYSEVAKAIQQSFQQNDRLEKEVEKLRSKEITLKSNISNCEDTLRHLNESSQQAQGELATIQSQQENDTRELETFRLEAKQEKAQIQKEVEDCRVKAGVTQTEFETARELKAILEKEGFSLELALSLCKEFGKVEKPREKLISVIEKHGSLQKYLDDLTEWGESQLKTYQSQIQSLQNNSQRLANDFSQQQARHSQGELLLQQQNQQIHANADILNSYNKYQPLRALIDYLGECKGVGFYHCTWCGVRYWILTYGNTSRNQTCLWCNMPMVGWDDQAYQAISRPPGIYQLIPQRGK
jgi:hypothetical protein